MKRFTDTEVACALAGFGSRWGWMAMPASMRRDYRRAFTIVAEERLAARKPAKPKERRARSGREVQT